jgi:hypothetical protein
MKINSKWIKDPTVRPETLRLLLNHRGNTTDVSIGHDFLEVTLQTEKTKAKIVEWDYIKLRSLGKVKRQTKE